MISYNLHKENFIIWTPFGLFGMVLPIFLAHFLLLATQKCPILSPKEEHSAHILLIFFNQMACYNIDKQNFTSWTQFALFVMVLTRIWPTFLLFLTKIAPEGAPLVHPPMEVYYLILTDLSPWGSFLMRKIGFSSIWQKLAFWGASFKGLPLKKCPKNRVPPKWGPPLGQHRQIWPNSSYGV